MKVYVLSVTNAHGDLTLLGVFDKPKRARENLELNMGIPSTKKRWSKSVNGSRYYVDGGDVFFVTEHKVQGKKWEG